MIRIALIAIPLALTACGRDEAAPPPPDPQIMVRSANQKQLLGLSDLNRAIAFKRAIADQGLTCRQIVSTGYAARYKNMDMWTATCADKRQWALFVGADDSVQVRPCGDNARFGLPPCTTQPGTEGGTGLDEVTGNAAR